MFLVVHKSHFIVIFAGQVVAVVCHLVEKTNHTLFWLRITAVIVMQLL